MQKTANLEWWNVANAKSMKHLFFVSRQTSTVFKTHFGVEVQKEQFVMMDSTSEIKTSIHVVLCGYHFKNVHALQNLMKKIDWSDKSVWLIGASSGIGLALAKALHARGARVVVSARQLPLLQEFVSAHPKATAHALDVNDLEQMHEVAQQIKTYQGLDCLLYTSPSPRDS